MQVHVHESVPADTFHVEPPSQLTSTRSSPLPTASEAVPTTRTEVKLNHEPLIGDAMATVGGVRS